MRASECNHGCLSFFLSFFSLMMIAMCTLGFLFVGWLVSSFFIKFIKLQYDMI